MFSAGRLRSSEKVQKNAGKIVRRKDLCASLDSHKFFIDNSARLQDLLTGNGLKFSASANANSKHYNVWR
jgi:hypothetical protein